MMKKKVILAYSGGLDTSVILKWLIHKGYEIVCYVADLGQEEDFEAVEKKALKIGASKVVIENLQEEFVTEYIFPSLKANAVYEGRYLLGTALARPLIAKKLVEIAKKENTSYISHGATGKGNDQIRFELSAMRLMPKVNVIAPWRDPEFLKQFQGRSDLIEYAKQYNIPISSTLEKPYSMDANLMHISYESGNLEDPSQAAENEMFLQTKSPMEAPDKEIEIAITFKEGIPVSIKNLSDNTLIKNPLPLFRYLNKLGSENGIGRVDIVESRFVGMKSRGVYETPAGTILLKAHMDLETMVLDREVIRLKETFAPKIAELIYNGLWFSPEMEFLMTAIDHSQKNVEGVVHISLYKGNAFVTSRASDKTLYNPSLASMEELGNYEQNDAEGFINIQALRLKLISEL